MIMIYYFDKKLKKTKTKQKTHVLEADIKTIKNNIDASSSKDIFFQDIFQMTTIALMTHLNSSIEVFDHPDALFFFWYGTNLLIDDYFEFSN